MQIIEERELTEHKENQITLSANPYQAREKLRQLDRQHSGRGLSSYFREVKYLEYSGELLEESAIWIRIDNRDGSVSSA